MNDKTDLAEALRNHEHQPRILASAIRAQSEDRRTIASSESAPLSFSAKQEGKR